MTWAECSSKINSFLSHLNTKLRLLPVFRLKLHWLSGGGPQMDLLQIWCIERSQWPDKQLRSQSADRVVPRSGGQFSALIAKSCEQVGGGWRAVVAVQQPVYEGWLVARRPLHPRSRSRYNPCAAAAIQSQSTAAPHQPPSQGMSAKLSPAAVKSCQAAQSCHLNALSRLPCRPSIIKLSVPSPWLPHCR